VRPNAKPCGVLLDCFLCLADALCLPSCRLPAFCEALAAGLLAASVLATAMDGLVNINAKSSDAIGVHFFVVL